MLRSCQLKKEVAGLGEGARLGRAMEEKDVLERVKKVVVAQLGVPDDHVTMAAHFTKDHGADPLRCCGREGAEARKSVAQALMRDMQGVGFMERGE
jgi:hypothetical protein